MDAMWLIPLAVFLLILWAGWVLRRRSPNRPGEDGTRREDWAKYHGGG
jgi:hypothetical protein